MCSMETRSALLTVYSEISEYVSADSEVYWCFSYQQLRIPKKDLSCRLHQKLPLRQLRSGRHHPQIPVGPIAVDSRLKRTHTYTHQDLYYQLLINNKIGGKSDFSLIPFRVQLDAICMTDTRQDHSTMKTEIVRHKTGPFCHKAGGSCSMKTKMRWTR